jgi:DNA-binding NarL/FixJ family response regulator
MPIRVIIVDDHEVVADGLRFVVSHQVDMEVVDCMHESREAVRRILETKPDVALLDHAMPGLNGTEAAAIIHERCPETRVIMLSMHSNRIHVMRALQAGASGYVLKKSAAKEVVEAIRAVHYGGRYLSRALAESVIDELVENRSGADPLQQLSSRERQVLQMLAEGHPVQEIAATLSLSPKTVETYRTRMMKKLNLQDFASLVKFAIQHDITSLD